ncbi:MAG: DNA repair protein RecN [Ahrensia sp.]
MLAELSIRDIVLIDQLTIRLDGGLSVLTGETGAGKSILLDALSLALGARGDAGLVRKGCEQGSVTAIFDVPAHLDMAAILAEANIELDAGEPVILRRVQAADGRTRGYINDQSASASLMRSVGQQLVEIHGQHADRALVDATAHRQLLDAFGRLGADVAAVAEAYRQWNTTRRALEQHRKQVAEAQREADYLRASFDELTKLAAEPGEEERLAAERTRMMQSEKIATDLNDANEVLSGMKSPVPEIGGLMRTLQRKAADVPQILEPVVEHLGRALDHLADAQNLIEVAINDSGFDARALEKTEERLFSLRAAARKFSVPVDGLCDLAIEMGDQLAALDAGESQLAALEKQELEAAALYDRLALALSEARLRTSEELCAAVMGELPALKLEHATFLVDAHSEPSQRTASGIDTIEFWVQTNPGTNPGPMMKVASGGELSRFLLALKVVLADRASAPTLVFDEIDTGVGGAVADAIGARLARLAGSVQVLSVTHAPQVAALASNHYLIAKKRGDTDLMATSVALMDEQDRLEEIARMLSGAQITDEARAAALRLLNAG